ncbi:hypothetical protein Zmor_010065 [Zophobas morio]|uniref:Uncharacterized protein n=1 Tax=Zophobas morio TaxID=2755281 RepID=A0AA38IJZ2_9CUCU|nr:hypothetical protein Zmor_010065 [Zophobas morio]
MAQTPFYRWIDSCTTDNDFPCTAYPIGADSSGHNVYVGRTHFEQVLGPVTVVPELKKASLPGNGKEHAIEKYQLLCMNHFQWLPSHDGKVLPGAIQGGYNKDGIPLYIGRVCHEGSWIVGTIHPKYGVCYYPYQGKELSTKQYEALVSHFYQV